MSCLIIYTVPWLYICIWSKSTHKTYVPLYKVSDLGSKWDRKPTGDGLDDSICDFDDINPEPLDEFQKENKHHENIVRNEQRGY